MGQAPSNAEHIQSFQLMDMQTKTPVQHLTLARVCVAFQSSAAIYRLFGAVAHPRAHGSFHRPVRRLCGSEKHAGGLLDEMRAVLQAFRYLNERTVWNRQFGRSVDSQAS